MSATRAVSPRRWLTARCKSNGGTRSCQLSHVTVSSQ